MTNPDQYTEADAAEYEAKLNDIVNDPDLTITEMLDELGDTMKEQFNEIGVGTTADATTSATTATETAPADDASATADVVGDPATASYSSAPAAGTHAPDAGIPSPAVEDSAAASAPASDLNAAVGVDGNVEYYSARNVDGDDSIDLAHSRVDGIDTITHYGEDGGITLVEQDMDHNGTYETAAAVRPDGTIRIAEDTDDDGQVDLATYYDPTTAQRVRQDEFDGAGRITASKFDSDGDGEPDVFLIDTDGDGRFDTADLDTDADNITNDTLVDTDGDGRFDLSLSDADGDGSQETYQTAATSGDGALGDISTYESLIPADDSYHTQAGTDTYEPPAVDDSYEPPVVHEVPGDLVCRATHTVPGPPPPPLSPPVRATTGILTAAASTTRDPPTIPGGFDCGRLRPGSGRPRLVRRRARHGDRRTCCLRRPCPGLLRSRRRYRGRTRAGTARRRHHR